MGMGKLPDFMLDTARVQNLHLIYGTLCFASTPHCNCSGTVRVRCTACHILSWVHLS